VKGLNDNRAVGESRSELSFNAEAQGQYGLLIEGAGGTSGTYTLWLLPQEN
jgi:hypothetical protein